MLIETIFQSLRFDLSAVAKSSVNTCLLKAICLDVISQ